ncbi:DUF309 domain-containing protein [Streptomyces thermolilacinus]|uniref:DUF309 domain-containing protein n=1 Tax=Streptomyces thermolilacinus SPC6 TaxID=1306406 RepID=A0A1D3DME9_9ACTN|nr:DUF309 domain-containing protein [Streptomyces thermolilacinus]OEJ93471.1 hypothetical protein J116_002320 [Streptomyces thermolilacinus SPC6]
MDRARRDRDVEGRARNARPRDGLGRPLPYGSPGVERQPEGVERPPEESLREAQRLLDAGLPFHAHEVLEDAWKACGDAGRGEERELWRGLAQLAVGLTHAARGNASGGARLLLRGADRIVPYGGGAEASAPGSYETGAARPGSDEGGASGPYGIDVDGLVRWARGLAERLGGGVDGGPGPGGDRSRGTGPAGGSGPGAVVVDPVVEAPRLTGR